MMKAARALYTLEFKREEVHLVESGQTMAAAAYTSRKSLTGSIYKGVPCF